MMAVFPEEIDPLVMALYFEELNQIREMGAINMFAAPQFLHETYGLNKDVAKTIFLEWTKTFEKN